MPASGRSSRFNDVDVADAALRKRATVTLPANIQYAWPHPSKRHFYVVSSSGGPGVAGDKHLANAFRVDPTSGARAARRACALLHGDPHQRRRERRISPHRLQCAEQCHGAPHRPRRHDRRSGRAAGQARRRHLRAPDPHHAGNRTAILVARGNNAAAGKPEDPGALKVYGFKDGALTNLASIAPGTGLGFGPRHLDFHPSEPWVFVSIERQNKLYVYRLAADGALGRVRSSETLADPANVKPAQGAGPITSIPTAVSSISPTATRARSSSRARRCSTAARTTSRCSPSTGRAASRS